MAKVKNLIGAKFNRLEPVKYHRACDDGRFHMWECLCDCGNTVFVRSASLTRGATQSCGCLHHEMMVERQTKHGLHKTLAYKTWKSMKTRCMNEKFNRFHRYGGRGITICDEWVESFDTFYSDMGERKHGYSIERKNVNRGYEPGNCVWIPHHLQSRNQEKSKLSPHKAGRIREFHSIGIKNKELAGMFGVCLTMIRMVVDGKSWR